MTVVWSRDKTRSFISYCKEEIKTMQVFLCVSAIVACLNFFGNPLLTSHHSHSLLNFTCYIFFNFMSQSLLLEATLPWGSSHSGWCLCFGLCCWCNGVHGSVTFFFFFGIGSFMLPFSFTITMHACCNLLKPFPCHHNEALTRTTLVMSHAVLVI